MDLLNQPIPLWMILCYMVFMALVQAFPQPTGADGKPYTILYQFLHGLSMNVKLLFDPIKKTLPSAKP